MFDGSLWRLIGFAASLTPGVVIMLILYRLGRRTLSTRLLGVAISSGAMIAMAPAMLGGFEKLILARLDPFNGTVLTAFVFAGLFEETAKLTAALVIVRGHFARRTNSDLILATAATALGFALIENAGYVLKSADTWQWVAAARAISSVPGHTLTGLYLGYGLVRAGEQSSSYKYWLVVLKTLCCAALLHGFYDFPLMLGALAPAFPPQLIQIASLTGLSASTVLAWSILAANIATCLAAWKALAWLSNSWNKGGEPTLQVTHIRPRWLERAVFAPATGMVLTAVLFAGALGLIVYAVQAASAGVIVNLWLFGLDAGVFLIMLAFLSAAGMGSAIKGSAAGVLEMPWGRRFASLGCAAMVIVLGCVLLNQPRRAVLARTLVESSGVYGLIGDFRKAVENDNSALAYSPNHLPALLQRGVANYQLRHYDLAIADLDETIRQSPNAGAYLMRAQIQEARHETGKQSEDIEHALALEPTNGDILVARGLLRLYDHDLERARGDFDQAIKINDKSASARMGLAELEIENKNSDQALADIQAAMTLSPNSSGPWSTRGQYRFNKGDFSGAAADFALSAQRGARDYEALWLYLARSRAKQNGRPELALLTARQLHQAWPAPIFALYLGLRDAPATLAAARDNDEKCEANFYVGEWLILQGLGDRAVAMMKEAVAICPNSFIEHRGAVAELSRLIQTDDNVSKSTVDSKPPQAQAPSAAKTFAETFAPKPVSTVRVSPKGEIIGDTSSLPRPRQAPSPKGPTFVALGNGAPPLNGDTCPLPLRAPVTTKVSQVVGFLSPEQATRMIGTTQARWNASISPDYIGQRRAVVEDDSGNTKARGVAIVPSDLSVQLGDSVETISAHRDPNLPCNYIPRMIKRVVTSAHLFH